MVGHEHYLIVLSLGRSGVIVGGHSDQGGFIATFSDWSTQGRQAHSTDCSVLYGFGSCYKIQRRTFSLFFFIPKKYFYKLHVVVPFRD